MYRLMLKSINRRQSPIDFRSNDLTVDENKCDKHSIEIIYVPNDCRFFKVYPGKKWMVSAEPGCSTTFRASHLPATYELLQFHGHWGADSSCGSEHTINGKAFAGEVHFVFYNTSYGSPEEASHHEDGVAVLGVFLQEGSYNADYGHLTSLVAESLDSETKTTELSEDFDMTRLIPIGSDYFHYDGGLTTPPYSEIVVWTVLAQPVEVSAHQLMHFRRICKQNYRRCQDRCGRKIYCSSSDILS